MIFDSPQILVLRKKYKKQPDFLVPHIILLDKLEKLSGERAYLEDIISSVSEKKQKDWLGRLLSEYHEQYMGAWFEMMLVGWCRDIGQVDIEPNLVGNFPDLSIMVGKKKIVIEARALLKTAEERNEEILSSGLIWALSQIKKSYVVEILEVSSSQFPDWSDFKDRAEKWLNTNPEEKFTYEDGSITVILQTLKITDADFKTVQVIESAGDPRWIDSDPVKQPLRKKAGQHKAIRQASYPYVIALYLESIFLSSKEVVKAWFGNETYVIDIDKHQVVNSYIDKSGIHFLGSRVLHTTVSGTLVFKYEWDKKEKRRCLIASYIQNPFAKVYINPKIFPVGARYVVKERGLKGFRMGWERWEEN